MADIYLNPKLGHVAANSYVTRNEASQYFAERYTDQSTWTNLTATQREQCLIQAALDMEIYNYKGSKYYPYQRLSFPRNYHRTWDGTASPTSTATKLTIHAKNLYSGTYNDMPNNYWDGGTVHITHGLNRGQSRFVASYTASIVGKYGEIVVSSPFTHNVAASDVFILFEPDDGVKWAQCEQALYIATNRNYQYGELQYMGIGYVRTGDLGMSFKDTDGTVGGKKVCMKARKLLGRHLRKVLRYGRA